MLKALGAARPGKVSGAIDVVHNTVTCEPVLGKPAWVHRKGCAPAFEGQPAIVLGTRGTESWVLLGRGSASSLRSVAHGADRKMSVVHSLEEAGAAQRLASLEPIITVKR